MTLHEYGYGLLCIGIGAAIGARTDYGDYVGALAIAGGFIAAVIEGVLQK